MTRHVRNEALAEASAAHAVEMERPTAEIPRAEIFALTQARLDVLCDQHLKKYSKVIQEALDTSHVQCAARKENGCADGTFKTGTAA
jgi:hypothetical protein